MGVVTDNDDPAGQGRVRLQLPQLTAVGPEPWARVMVAYGAPQPVLPQVNDGVLVLLIDGQPDDPIVLGKLPG